MKLTVKYRIEVTDEQEKLLKKLGYYATKLYNTDNWQRREIWAQTGKIPNWYEQKKKLKDNHWYKLLPSQTAQAIIKNLQDNYNSWFHLRKENPNASGNRKKIKFLMVWLIRVRVQALQFARLRRLLLPSGVATGTHRGLLPSNEGIFCSNVNSLPTSSSVSVIPSFCIAGIRSS